jgi:chaperonin cofactor prefoldin
MEDNISEVNESPINKLTAIHRALNDIFNDVLIVNTQTGKQILFNASNSLFNELSDVISKIQIELTVAHKTIDQLNTKLDEFTLDKKCCD